MILISCSNYPQKTLTRQCIQQAVSFNINIFKQQRGISCDFVELYQIRLTVIDLQISKSVSD